MGAASWTSATVAECLEPVSLAGRTKVQARDYRASGRFPVVDQGQGEIAGWTDDESAVITEPLPLIVFGDHTRALQFVDYPFARGADGTQLMKPKAGIDPRFFFYACRAIDLPARGYNRHFTVLKEWEIAFPPDLEEQQEIGAVLSQIEAALEHQRALVATAEDLRRSVRRELFAYGLRGEPLKETEFGPVPESWQIAPVGAHFSVSSGGTPSRGNPAFWTGGTIPWVKTTEVKYRPILTTEERITRAGLDGSAAKLLPPGTLLLAMYGQGVTRGKVAMLGIEAACNQACAAIRSTDGCVETKYLYHFLASRYEAIRQLAHGGQQQNLNLDIVRELPVAFPPSMEEQREIVAILDLIDRKIELHRQKRAVLEELFKALLHKLMTGDLPVADLDLSVLGSPEITEVEATA